MTEYGSCSFALLVKLCQNKPSKTIRARARSRVLVDLNQADRDGEWKKVYDPAMHVPREEVSVK